MQEFENLTKLPADVLSAIPESIRRKAAYEAAKPAYRVDKTVGGLAYSAALEAVGLSRVKPRRKANAPATIGATGTVEGTGTVNPVTGMTPTDEALTGSTPPPRKRWSAQHVIDQVDAVWPECWVTVKPKAKDPKGACYQALRRHSAAGTHPQQAAEAVFGAAYGVVMAKLEAAAK